MSSKAYSPEQREALRIQLLNTGLKLYSRHGIRAVRLADILEIVGISKPFFYKFFESVAEFVIAVLNFQWGQFTVMLADVNRQEGVDWDGRVRTILDRLIHHHEHGLLIMTQEEEVWVRSRVSDSLYESFMTNQITYFEALLCMWEIPPEHCDPRVLANMILCIVVTYNSARQALPFFYLEALERTAQAQAESLIVYLNALRKPATNHLPLDS